MRQQSSICSLKKGDTATIVGYRTTDIPIKVYEMGLVPGVTLTLKQRLPFQGPVGVQVNGNPNGIALRRTEADLILIESLSVMTEIMIALVGNPNVGKSTLFNKLTGLRQKAGNYPGITVEKKTGSFVDGTFRYEVIDLPGAYGVHPSSLDEEVVYDVLIDGHNDNHPDL